MQITTPITNLEKTGDLEPEWECAYTFKLRTTYLTFMLQYLHYIPSWRTGLGSYF